MEARGVGRWSSPEESVQLRLFLDDGLRVRKEPHREAIVTVVEELEATLADCAIRIMETNGVPLGGDLDHQRISQRLDKVRSQLSTVAAKNAMLRDAHLPNDRGIGPEMRRLGIHCSRFIEVQTSALGGVVDVLTVTSGAEGEDLEYLRKTVQYFEDAYEEHRQLTALVLGDEGEAGATLDDLHLRDVDTGIINFCRQISEFGEFRSAMVDRRSDSSSSRDACSEQVTH